MLILYSYEYAGGTVKDCGTVKTVPYGVYPEGNMADFSNEIYDKNIQTLKEFYPEIVLDGAEPECKFIVEDCKNGQKTIRVNIDGKYKYAHSKFDPEKEAQKWSDAVKINRNSKIIVYGLGFAYHIEELAERLEDSNMLYIVEPDFDIFSELLKNRNVSDLLKNEKVKLLFDNTQNAGRKLFANIISWQDSHNIIYAKLPIYEELYPEKYLAFIKDFRNGFGKIGVDRNTMALFVDKWHQLGFANLKYLPGSINYMGFFEAFKGVPCVLVSAGPSLNKNVHLLKEIKGKFPILCVYTAYKVLKKNGIEPDFIISIDSRQTHFETAEVRSELIDTPLFCESISDKDLLERHTGHKMFIPGSCSPFVCQLFINLRKTYRKVVSGGSVACMALDLLVLMGGNPIILIGQDLAFTGRKTHAEGTFYDSNNKLDADKKYIMTKDINGEDIPTNEAYLSFKTWFDYYITDRKDKIDFIDATEGGAKIENTKIMTFRDAIDQNIEKGVDVESVLKEIYSNNPLFIDDEERRFLEILREMEKSIAGLEGKLKKGVSQSKKLLKIYGKNEQNTKKGIVDKCITELNSIDKSLKKQVSSLTVILLLFGKIQHALVNFDDDKKLSDELYILNKNLLLYGGLKEQIEAVKPVLSEAIKEFEDTINAEEKCL